MYFRKGQETRQREQGRRMKTPQMNGWKAFCTPPLVTTVISGILLLLNGCSSGLKLTSEWQQQEMNIDGTDAQWQRGLYYEKESDIVYGVRNDERYVYVFLKTQNRSTLMQIMRQGFTVWFDRENGKNKTFGIQYPMGRHGAPAGFTSDSTEERTHTVLDQEFPELAILGPTKKDIQRFSALETPGIRVKLGRINGTLIYELRVPLQKTPGQPFAIEPASSSRIGIEFETGEFNRDEVNAGPHAREEGTRSGGMMEENPEERSGLEGSRRPYGTEFQGGHIGARGQTKRMEFWLSVQLANRVSP